MKFLIIFLIGLYLSVPTTSADVKGALEKIVEDALNKIHHLVTKITNDVKNFVDECLKKIASNTDWAKTIIDTTAESIYKKINEAKIKNEYSRKCVEAHENEFNEIKRLVQNEVAECDKNTIYKLKNIKSESAVEKELENVEKCKTDLREIVGECVRVHPKAALWCVTKRVSDIMHDFVEISSSVTSAVSEAGKASNKIVQEGADCVKSAIEQYGKKFDAIHHEVEKCLQKQTDEFLNNYFLM